MNKYQAIKYLFPKIDDKDFCVRDDGKGQYIAEWNIAEEKPTDEQLQVAYDLFVIEDAKNKRKLEIRKQLDANDLKAIRAIADGDIVRINEHKTKQQLLRDELSGL